MMNKIDLQFHHLGLAVRNPEKAIQMLSILEYQIGEKVFDPLQKVNLIFCKAKIQPDIEIIFPETSPSPIDKILNTNNELIYHLCYKTRDLQRTLAHLKSIGLRIFPLVKSKPAILFNNQHVSFYQVAGFGMIEILEEL
jgi:hypothetical protein